LSTVRSTYRLHDASIGFGSDSAVWQAPTKIPAEVVCHNDFAPHNLAFRDGRIVGAIDFDFCSPGPRLWDIAYEHVGLVDVALSEQLGAAVEGARLEGGQQGGDVVGVKAAEQLSRTQHAQLVFAARPA